MYRKHQIKSIAEMFEKITKFCSIPNCFGTTRVTMKYVTLFILTYILHFLTDLEIKGTELVEYLTSHFYVKN